MKALCQLGEKESMLCPIVDSAPKIVTPKKPTHSKFLRGLCFFKQFILASDGCLNVFAGKIGSNMVIWKEVQQDLDDF